VSKDLTRKLSLTQPNLTEESRLSIFMIKRRKLSSKLARWWEEDALKSGHLTRA